MWRLIGRGLTMACAACGQRRLFRRARLYKMHTNCPRCGLRFERVEGHWLGAVAVNTVVTAALILTVLVLLMVTLGTDTSRWALLAMVAPFGTIFPALFDPISRTLWTAIDLAFRPAGPDEVDLPYARTAGHEPFVRDGVLTDEDMRDQPPESHD